MSDIKQAFGAASTLTCTLASLASSATAGRESTVIDNSSSLLLDVLVQLQVKLQSGTPANDKGVHVYVYASADDGTTYTDGASGSDAALTPTDPPNLIYLGFVSAPTTAGTFKGGPWSVAQAFGGRMPKRWGIWVRNYTGIALSATEGDHKKLYQGVYLTVG